MDQRREGSAAGLPLHYTSEEGVDVPILEVGEGDRSPGGSHMLSEGAGFGKGGVGS